MIDLEHVGVLPWCICNTDDGLSFKIGKSVYYPQIQKVHALHDGLSSCGMAFRNVERRTLSGVRSTAPGLL